MLLFPFISSSTGKLEAVMEFIRNEDDAQFHEEDEEIVNSYLVWGEVAIHYADLYGKVGRQKDLSGFLLSIGNLMKKIHFIIFSEKSSLVKCRVFYFCAELRVFLSEGRLLHESVVIYFYILGHQI